MVGLQAQQFSPLYRSQINSYTPCMSMTTYSYRIKDATSRKHLIKMAYAVHMVWNYCQEICLLAWRRERNFLSAYDLHKLIGGIAKDLRLNTDTMQQVCTEYVREC